MGNGRGGGSCEVGEALIWALRGFHMRGSHARHMRGSYERKWLKGQRRTARGGACVAQQPPMRTRIPATSAYPNMRAKNSRTNQICAQWRVCYKLRAPCGWGKWSLSRENDRLAPPGSPNLSREERGRGG